jgi:hypothetical protein
MLKGSGDHMIAALKHTLDGNVQRRGGIWGKCDSVGAFRAKQLRQRTAGVIYNPGGIQRYAVRAPAGIAAISKKTGHHGLRYRPRLRETGSGMIQIDHVPSPHFLTGIPADSNTVCTFFL